MASQWTEEERQEALRRREQGGAIIADVAELKSSLKFVPQVLVYTFFLSAFWAPNRKRKHTFRMRYLLS